jgi:hypothetical protein
VGKMLIKGVLLARGLPCIVHGASRTSSARPSENISTTMLMDTSRSRVS